MYVARLRINGFRGFHGPRACDLDFERPDGGYAGWTVLAGRNGSGKTTLLRSIAIGLAGPKRAGQLDGDLETQLSYGASRGKLAVDVLPDPGVDTGTREPDKITAEALWEPEWESEPGQDDPPIELVFQQDRERSARNVLDYLWSSTPPPGWFHAAYGPFRRLTGTGLYERTPQVPDRTTALRTLFEEQSALTEAFDWLLSLHLRALENKPGAAALKYGVIDFLNGGLLPEPYHIEGVDSDGMWLRHLGGEDGTEGPLIELRRMSDGQRTVVALVLDIVRQMHAAYGELTFRTEHQRTYLPHPGVVLIDEVDAHLHPSWQQRIGDWLKSRFPAVQFIVTTHSPYVCQASDPGGLIRVPGPTENASPGPVSEELRQRIAYGTGDDAVLSELFGLDTPYSEQARALRQELVELEARVVTGEATDDEEARHAALRARLSSSPRTRAVELQARLKRLGVFDE